MSASSGTDAAKASAAFYDALRAAYEAHDIDQFIRVASDFYLTSAIHRLSDLQPISRAAYVLFDGMGSIIQKPPVDRFFAQHADADLVAYMSEVLFGELRRVSDTILCLEALRLHGSQRQLVHTRLLKALYGLAMAHGLHAHEPEKWSIAPVIELFQMPIFVPGWVWELDPCDRRRVKGAGHTVPVPPIPSPTDAAVPVSSVPSPIDAGPVTSVANRASAAEVSALPLMERWRAVYDRLTVGASGVSLPVPRAPSPADAGLATSAPSPVPETPAPSPANAGPVTSASSPASAAELAGSPLIEKRNAVALYSAALTRPPNEKLCECTCDDRCVPQSPCCAKIKSFITELLIVRETLQCYVPADIAYIENVLAGETRTRKHESLLQIEQKQETETTVSSSEEHDHQRSERSELSSETQKTIENDAQIDAGVTANQKWGTGSATMTTNVSFGSSVSTSEKAARNYALDVVERSVSKIEKSVRQLVSRSVLSRTREVNTHVFSRAGEDLTVGIYTWVSKTLKAQVFSYGRRMVYEFILPEPAALYKALLIKAFGLDEKFTGGKPPVAPPHASGITVGNYLSLVDTYGVDDAPAPPDATKTITLAAGDTPGPAHRAWEPVGPWRYSGMQSKSGAISVPAGYTTTSMSGSPGVAFNGHDPGTANLVIQIGPYYLVWYDPSTPGTDASSAQLPGLEAQLPVVFNAFNVTYYNATLTIVCALKPEALHSWQAAMHKLLVDAYQKQKEAHDAALAAFQAAQAEKKKAMEDFIRNRNPFFNRETERTELKRLAISWLSCQHFDQFNAMKRRVQPCGLPQMNLPEAEEEGKIIRFWEQALDWNLMTYLFYPYFWSAKCAWADKVAEDSGDGLFDKFMQAGAARVQVPVAEGFEDYMQYWENTGQIWGQDGEPPTDDTNPHWISMVQEIKHQQDCYLNDREGRIDTNPPFNVVTIKGSDRYWDPLLGLSGDVDPNAIAMDLDREISIDTVVYRIVDIAKDQNSPSFDASHPNLMWWTVTLDRPYEGVQAMGLPYAVGAKYVGAPWIVTVPTNLVWLKNDKYCLPCYPVTCKGE